MVEFECVDDFSFRTEEFASLAKDIAMQIAACNPGETANGQEVLSLLNQSFVKNESLSVRNRIEEVESALGVRILVKRYARYSAET
jgi:translation elongation factor EF-Ts